MPAGFGDFLEQKMAGRHFSPTDLSHFTGISRPTVYRHLSGATTPSAVDRERYAKAFGMSLKEFDDGWLEQASRVPDVTHGITLDPDMADALARASEAGLEDVEIRNAIHAAVDAKLAAKHPGFPIQERRDAWAGVVGEGTPDLDAWAKLAPMLTDDERRRVRDAKDEQAVLGVLRDLVDRMGDKRVGRKVRAFRPLPSAPHVDQGDRAKPAGDRLGQPLTPPQGVPGPEA